MIKGTHLTNIIDRRSAISGLAALCSSLGLGSSGAIADVKFSDTERNSATRFTRQQVRDLAKSLSQKAYRDEHLDLPSGWENFSYEEYRDISYRPEKSIWRGRRSPFELQLFAPGGLFVKPVDLFVVERGRARKLEFSNDLFSFGDIVSGRQSPPNDTRKTSRAQRHAARNNEETLTFSGFRIHGYVNRRKFKDEFAVFQGASYFRAVGRKQSYGLSARGLAIDTAQPTGEEFPYFRAFWIEQPSRHDKTITIHALLDSPSVTGAYRFVIRPGKNTVIDTELTLFPRRDVFHVGIAPLTSMFFYGYGKSNKFDDFRPAVHDSEALVIHNGNDEHLWRPLINSRQLQMSDFADENPKGFGLMQRDRDFDHYQDLVARYDNRPSLWIEPKGNWGKGSVVLVEIPTKSEIHDNIAAFWKPQIPLRPGKSVSFAYRMHWGTDPRKKSRLARVAHSLEGQETGKKRRFIIEFVGRNLTRNGELPELIVTSSAGRITHDGLIPNPVTGGLRASLVIDTLQEKLIDLRLGLYHNKRPISEIWTNRWVAS